MFATRSRFFHGKQMNNLNFCVLITTDDFLLENCKVTSQNRGCIGIFGNGIKPVIRNCTLVAPNSSAITVRTGANPVIEDNIISSCRVGIILCN